MKRHIQKTGVRKFFGQDFIDLQAEPLKALDAFFAEYGQCIIQGCTITETEGGTFDVAPGLVALESTDPESGAVAIHVMPFAGAASVALPLYLAAKWVVAERAYGDGKVKPIAYDLLALASGVAPEAPHLVLNAVGANRFVDALQDGTHRFVSDAERTKWNDILRQAKEYAAAQAATAAASAQATAVGLAKAHTDTTAAAVRDELAVGDASTLVGAKQYADRIVAALIDGSPEMLNTLQELAAALGGDPNFATTVMTEIGKRVTTEAMTTAIAGKANVSHKHEQGDLTGVLIARPLGTGGVNVWGNATGFSGEDEKITPSGGSASFLSFGAPGYETQLRLDGYAAWQGGWNRFYFRSKNSDNNSVSNWREFYHTGNFDPNNKADIIYVDTELEKKAPMSHTHGISDLSGVVKVQPRYGGGVNAWGNATGFSEVDEKLTPNGGASSFISFGLPGYEIEMRLDSYGAWLGGWNRFYFRSRNADDGLIANWKEFWHTGNLGRVTASADGLMAAVDKAKLDAMPTKIIRGSVTAAGTSGGGNADSVGVVYGESAMVRVTHNLGTDNYSATASAVSNGSNIHADNVVTVWRKGIYDVDYVVTAGRGGEREMCAFDYLIIPY